MVEYGAPLVFALATWWLSTGAILYLVGLPRHTLRWTLLAATCLMALALHGLAITASQATTAGAYGAFAFGLLLFGVQEIGFYTGFVTGPRKSACPDGCSGARHFVHGVQAVLYHELALILAAVVCLWLTWSEPNPIGAWTFLVLWWMQQSAKLNLFFGARNLSEEFLPAHLRYLASFFRRRSMNLLFPFSVTISTVVTVLLAQQAMDPAASAFQRAGFIMLTTLMALAVLEHWFLVLPLDATRLWRWSLDSRTTKNDAGGARLAALLGRRP